MKIYVKKKTKRAIMPIVLDNGDWFDLAVPNQVIIEEPNVFSSQDGSKTTVRFASNLIDLEIAIKLPKGYEALVLPRSSTYKRYGIILGNSQGIIDNSFCGDGDTWKFGAVAFKSVNIPAGTRIAQFRVQLSQKATIWQKIKWLFDQKIEFVEVKSLNSKDRGGIGSTGD